MQAIVKAGHGRPVLRDIPEPSKDVMDIHATSLNKADWHAMAGQPWIMRLFKIPVIGADVAGIPRDGRWAGQRVCAEAGSTSYAGHCEVGSVPDTHMAPIPDGMRFEDAACLPVAGLTALQGLRDWGQLQEGKRVLVNGASGGVGSFAVQVARALGADVTAVCSAKNVPFVRGLGVDEIWAYDERGLDGQFDVFFDAAAYRPFKDVMQHVAPDGRYLFIGGSMKLMLPSMTTAKLRYGKRLVNGIAKANGDDLAQLVSWAADGTIHVPRTATLTLPEVSDALVRMGEGRTVGKVAVRIRGP
ncbi:MAG: NAD(P)-dependent alcohol dehydrogenase [Thermoplasmatota archaeon]